ncbi:hypothetical protein DXG01_012964 [Tephrocybe rancida]|nr:hypothetical protein DXG01_012964 [Tephrocybe rancida]
MSCEVLADKLDQENSGDPNAKYGIQYPKNYLNFMVLMRSHGHNSATQFGILSMEIPAPSSRHLRTLVANLEDVLQNPHLVYENVACVKRFVDSINYTGLLVVASDCTKVRSQLTFSTDYGAHVLGSVLPLEAVKVDDTEDIDRIIKKVRDNKVLAMQILKMAARVKQPVASFAADGASSELLAQSIMNRQLSDLPPLTYDNSLYGIHIRIPVFDTTGPVVSNFDPPHSRKTCRNQPQHGTHTLVIIYSITYQDQAFCPWLMGTDFIEHFFGISRMILPNFTYGEFLKMGNSKSNESATQLQAEDKKLATVKVTNKDLDALVALAFCEVYHLVKEVLHITISLPTNTTPLDLSPLTASQATKKLSKKQKPGEESDEENNCLINFDSDSKDEDD